MILLLVGAILTFGSVPTNSGISRNPMSMMDIWMNRTEDGNVLVAHGVNSWPALLEQLTESTFAKSAMIEGDVLLYKQRKHRHRAIPLMSAPSRLADRITFKEWLYEVTKLNKVVKINVRTTEAVRPVLQYLFAAHKEITSPIVLHANVFRSPRSIEPTVDADALVEETKRFFPEATLSLGWTKSNVTNLTKAQHRISWRELFHIIGLLFDVQQSVMISVRLTAALCSVEELSFLLGMRPTISVLIWSDETDIIHDWSPLVTLRSTPYSKRLIFDLNSDHVKMLKILPYQSANVKSGGFIRKHWHRIEFPLASSMPSGIVESDEGVAFLGWPKSFLISLIQPPLFPSQQTLSAKIKFIKKRGAPDELLKERSGLAVYFLEKVVDIQSPNIDDGIMESDLDFNVNSMSFALQKTEGTDDPFNSIDFVR
ncbi:hypothetical protein AB6A40_003736 [Gnathostoma spinigerum]|uniref:Uncharacterized protein n=1 Tax=Gnathostoma spinigerum TaxID=75299 RepID=A0ABD6EK06_9BILA